MGTIITVLTILAIGYMLGWTGANHQFGKYYEEKLVEYQNKIINGDLKLDDPVEDYISKAVSDAFDQGFDEGTGIGMDVGMRMSR